MTGDTMKRCPVCGESFLSGILCPVCGSMLTDTGGEISRLKINKRSAFHDSIRWKKPDPGDSSGSASVSGLKGEASSVSSLKSTVGKKRADTPRTPPPEEPPHEKEASGYEGISFPGWEVVRKIGEGSFGGVYEIQRILPGGRVEKCALKKLTVPKDNGEIQELYAQSFNTKNITAHFKNQMQELVSEYALTQDLCGCKNVVTCHDVQCVQHSDGIGWDIYIRMELLKPLAQVLCTDYQDADVLKLGLNLCNALLACQEHSIIHRDIKPENILVSDKGEYKLGDFGIAKVSEKAATGTMTGTMSYMAPEVANRRHYGAQADIYSLGMVLYWMMNMRTLPFLPFPPAIPTSTQRQEAAARRFSGESFPPPVNGTPELKAVVMKACAFSTEKRYQTAQELRRDLYACLRQYRAERDVSHKADGESG